MLRLPLEVMLLREVVNQEEILLQEESDFD
jgi:hypothetical protein